MMRRSLAILIAVPLLAGLPFSASAAPAGQDMRLRVVDVGNGLCVVVQIPGGHSLLYDAGDKGSYCRDAVAALIPDDHIDLVVLSHSDGDHIGELPEILQAKRAGTIVFPGDHHLDETDATRDEIVAIATAERGGARVWNLATTPLPDPDSTNSRVFMLGTARVSLIAGWSNGDMTVGFDETALPKAEHNNALSVVVRVEYGGHAVLLTGDTVGRFRGDEPGKCAYAERIMSGRTNAWPIASEILIGQHHGGDNASSNCFIRAVRPKYVIFSAGHKNYRHPSQGAADRFTSFGVKPDDMFRTDRGDDEGPGEWQYGDIKGCVDQPGDDDVDIAVPADNAPVRVSYRQLAVPCPVHTKKYFR